MRYSKGHMETSEETIYSKIIRREVPSEIVYENDFTIAFLDIVGPVAKGHTLVIPKRQFVNIFDIDDETLDQIWATIRKIAPVVRNAVGATGVNINSNHGADAGQVIPHIHFHIVPRFEGDGLEFWPEIQTTPEEISAIALKIRESIAA